MVSTILLITGSTVIPLWFVACVFSPLFLKMGVSSPAFNVSGTRPCLKISLVIRRNNFSISFPALMMCSIVRPW